ncbi:MAG: glycosyltransferase, partial [Anaerolineales bacterium]
MFARIGRRFRRHTLYRLQNALFALRRYLPGPARQILKPIYRRWWRRASQKKLAEALAQYAGAASATGYAILCFSTIDWELRFQRPQQLLLRLARGAAPPPHPVFYLRTDFQPGNVAAPLEPLAPNVFGLRLPGPASLNIYQAQPAPAHLESWLRALDALRRSEHLREVICLVQLPFWGPLALAIRERWGWKVVYDCLDEYAGFSTSTPALMAQERKLIAESDLVLATARRLHDKCAPLARRCVLLPNAADYEHFQQPSDRTALPNVRGPVVGYYGALAEWFDAALVEAAARAHPEWQFVLIGLKSGAALRALERLPNVHLLGEQPYARLPDYLHRFDAALIPFKRDALTLATNPVKFYEYMSAGKPVVATDLPELGPYRALFYPASTAEEFVHQLEAALAERDPAR